MCLGPLFGPLPGGGFGFLDGMSPEAVEAQGVSNLMAALQQQEGKEGGGLAKRAERSSELVLPMRSAQELTKWQRMDDVIMGGQSRSAMSPAPDGTGAVWFGDLIVEGGGFCGCRTERMRLDLSAYDGITLRVKGDGQIFKLNIKTVAQEDTPESTYQATFDTAPTGDWTTVHLPWHNFVPVKRAQWDPEGVPLDGSSISTFGLVLSRFEFNKAPNPSYRYSILHVSVSLQYGPRGSV